MILRRDRVTSAAVVSLMVLSACSGDNGSTGSAPRKTGAVPQAGQSPAEPITPKDFDPSLFGNDSANIDNRWLPLEPGTKAIWDGHAFDGEARVHRRVVEVITDLTKVIAGVRTRVGWSRDFTDGLMEESELFFEAQDRYGNVWHMGEYRETYDEEEFVGGRLWIQGDPKGAHAGILMEADPRLDQTFAQGFAPDPWNWHDIGRVYREGVRTCAPIGCFDEVLVIEEFEPLKPGAFQLKYYAPGVGNVRVGWRGPNEEEREVLVLTKLERLSPEALAEARAQALQQEHRGYAYGRTAPAQQSAA